MGSWFGLCIKNQMNSLKKKTMMHREHDDGGGVGDGIGTTPPCSCTICKERICPRVGHLVRFPGVIGNSFDASVLSYPAGIGLVVATEGIHIDIMRDNGAIIQIYRASATVLE